MYNSNQKIILENALFLNEGSKFNPKNKYTISPYLGVGPLSFGLQRQEVRNRIGAAYDEFKKTSSSKTTTDNFGFCHIFYEKSGKTEIMIAIEFIEDVNISYKGNNLFKMTYSEIKDLFKSYGDFQEIDDGFISTIAGISIFTSDFETIGSILIFKKGYYNT